MIHNKQPFATKKLAKLLLFVNKFAPDFKVGPMVYKEALDDFTLNGRICQILMASYPQICWFYYVQGSLRSNPGKF
jgi:hypothetical protein